MLFVPYSIADVIMWAILNFSSVVVVVAFGFGDGSNVTDEMTSAVNDVNCCCLWIVSNCLLLLISIAR